MIRTTVWSSPGNTPAIRRPDQRGQDQTLRTEISWSYSESVLKHNIMISVFRASEYHLSHFINVIDFLSNVTIFLSHMLFQSTMQLILH